MYLHIYSNYYIYNGTNKFKISNFQYKILMLYVEKLGNYESVVNELLYGNRNIIFYKILLHKVKRLVVNFKKNIEDDENLGTVKLTGEYGKFYPMCLNIELTDYCNFFCGHCYKESSCKKSKFIDIETIKRICHDYAGKIQIIHLTGGEPFSHPQINEILNLLFEANFKVNVTTNGSLWKNVNKIFLKKINRIQISIYGCDEKTYKECTGADSFNNVREFINYLNSSKLKYNVSFIFNKVYLKYFKEYNKFIANMPYEKIIMGFADSAGRYSKNSIWNLSNKERKMCKKYSQPYYGSNGKKTKESSICDAGTLSYCLREDSVFCLCQANAKGIFVIGNFEELNKRIDYNDFNIKILARKNRDSLSNMCRLKK